MSSRVRILVFLLLVALPAAPPVDALPASAAPGGEEQNRFLEVRQRQVELRQARAELGRAQELFAEGLVPASELERVRTRMESTQLAYQAAVLSLIALQPRITVERAFKFEEADGRKYVRLTVANRTPTFDDSQFALLSNVDGDDPLPASLRTRDVRDIFISLKDTGERSVAGGEGLRGTTVGLPYEDHVEHLAYGASRTLTFQLLRDVQSVLVAVSFKGQVNEIDIQLQNAASERDIDLSSTQLSQEADLGSQATYRLVLTRSTVDVRGFQLKLLNLPRQIGYAFVEPNNGARLSQINFPAGVTQQSLELRLFLPEQADERVPVDQPVEFWAVATGGAAALDEHLAYTADAIAATRAGALRLQVIPRGVGRVNVTADSLYSEVAAGQSLQTKLTVRNNGTRRLDNLKVLVDAPTNWRAEVTPPVIPSLDIDQEELVSVKLLPPSDVVRGDYEARLRTESYAYDRRVVSEEKILRVSVRPHGGLWTSALLVIAFATVAGGLVFFSIRLQRR